MRAAAPRCLGAAPHAAPAARLVARPAAPLAPRSRAARGAAPSLQRAAAAADGAGAPAAEVRDALRAASGIISDASVPEAHRGLHEALYGDGGAEAHDAGRAYAAREGEDDGSALVPLRDWLAAREGAAPAGVYAVHDATKQLQFVSFSRNVVLSLRGHLAQVGPERAAFARVMVFANKAMCSRANLEAEASAWLRAAGPAAPPGNSAEAALWGCGVPGGAEAVMTPAERASFEDKKLKMQRAMGVKDAAADAAAAAAAEAAAANPSDAAAQRRADTIRAMQAGDWSQVVDGQTREAVGDASATSASGATSAAAAPYVVSPFSRASVHRAVGGPPADADAPPPPPREMSVASVDAALNEVRPYLIADGGNVEVVSVERGIVALRLQGACGTCSSSAATMKMGIERALKTAFGDALKEVVQLGAATPGVAPTDAAMVTAHLDVLAPAIKAYGGVVAVKRVAAGVVVIGFRGPAPLGQGIVAAVRDKFIDVREVLLEEP